MSASINEQVSSQERQKVWTELRSLRQDTQAFRTEAYRLRTAGSLDAATNERLRSQQLELERQGEALIKRYARYHIPYFCCKTYGEQTFAWTRMERGARLGYATVSAFRLSHRQLPYLASDDAMNVLQLPPSASQPQLTAGNSLQLQVSVHADRSTDS